jgi:inorganic pyrophosphatase
VRFAARAYEECVKKIRWVCLVMISVWPCTSVPLRPIVGGAPVARAALALDEETVAGGEHFWRGYPADDGAGGVNAVIEIPCGTVGKFEVADDDGWLHWQHDRETGLRRAVDYLAFPVNYGMVPSTLAEDGDALDIVVLGGGIERGRVARTRVIGVLEMGEPGERDDKLIAVPAEAGLDNGFSRLYDLGELDAAYPNVRTILELWFASYWGLGRTHVLGWGDAAEAAQILEASKRAFSEGRSARLAAAALHLRASSRSDAHAR